VLLIHVMPEWGGSGCDISPFGLIRGGTKEYVFENTEALRSISVEIIKTAFEW
jgi:hypothetical protein